MKYIQWMDINGFRRIDGRLFGTGSQLLVLIGANGVGKTSMLEAIDCIRAAAQKQIVEQFSKLGGYQHIVAYDNPKKNLRIGLGCYFKGESSERDMLWVYDLKLVASGVSYSFESESVRRHNVANGEDLLVLSRELNDTQYFDSHIQGSLRTPAESALSQHPHLEDSILSELVSFLSSIRYFHSICIERGSPIRTPQPIKPTALPGANGEDLISCLYNIRIADRARFELVEDTLRAAFPSFEYIDFPPVAAGMLSMLWKDKQFTQPLYPHQLSEGTLRFLWLTALLYSPELPAVTLIDEPEVSLHPRMLSLLADMLREASQRAQIIVATQSESLVRFMQPEEVLVMDLDEEGHTTAKWADEMNLGDWLEDYTMDKLWRIGLLEER
jgi:predicted ATPase